MSYYTVNIFWIRAPPRCTLTMSSAASNVYKRQVALPAATRGAIAVYVQSKDTAGGTAALTFDAAGTDVWATSSLIESRAANEVTFDTSAANETKLVFTPADAATNVLTTGGKIAFMCFEEGTWHIATEFTGAAAAVTGAFAFAA